MSVVNGAFAARLVPLALGLGVIGMIDSSNQSVHARKDVSQPIHCEIQVEQRENTVALKGVVFATTPIEGSYQMRVSKSGAAGSSDINQSGGFSAGPGSPSTLGTVKLGGNGGSYVAKLTVTWGGRSIECTERVRGTL